MRLLVRFLRLPSADRALLVRAGLLVPAVRLALWLTSFDRTRRVLASWAQSAVWRPAAAAPGDAERILWSVRTVARHVPRASCLTQALAADALLDRYAIRHELKIGVARSDSGALEAHAWIERDGRVALGDLADLERYTPLPPLRGTST